MTEDTRTDFFELTRLREYVQMFGTLMDQLPIYATKIGYRYDSTPDERGFGEDMFRLHERWQELRGAR